jgi:sRNA-binding carbon storage regulator CsrA
MQANSELTIEIRAGEKILVGDVSVELVHKSGQAARLKVIAPRDTSIKKDSGVRTKRD